MKQTYSGVLGVWENDLVIGVYNVDIWGKEETKPTWYKVGATHLQPIKDINPTTLYEIDVEIKFSKVTRGMNYSEPLSLNFEMSFDYE